VNSGEENFYFFKKEWKRKESRAKEKGDFMEGGLLSLARPTNAYAYCSLRVRRFPTVRIIICWRTRLVEVQRTVLIGSGA